MRLSAEMFDLTCDFVILGLTNLCGMVSAFIVETSKQFTLQLSSVISVVKRALVLGTFCEYIGG